LRADVGQGQGLLPNRFQIITSGQPPIAVRAGLDPGTSRPRLHPGIALRMGVAGAIVYLTGWGPLLAVAFAVVATMHLRAHPGPQREALWSRACCS
jgi:hypothetical protein